MTNEESGVRIVATGTPQFTNYMKKIMLITVANSGHGNPAGRVGGRTCWGG